jgi:hypothetical protein
MVKGLVAIVCLAAAAFCFYTLRTSADAGTLYLIGGIVFALLTATFGVMFLSGRVNKTEDIHITE